MVHNPKLWTLWHYRYLIYRLWWFCLTWLKCKLEPHQDMVGNCDYWVPLDSHSQMSGRHVSFLSVQMEFAPIHRIPKIKSYTSCFHPKFALVVCFPWSINENHLQPPILLNHRTLSAIHGLLIDLAGIFTEPNRPIFFRAYTIGPECGVFVLWINPL